MLFCKIIILRRRLFFVLQIYNSSHESRHSRANFEKPKDVNFLIHTQTEPFGITVTRLSTGATLCVNK